MAVSCTRTVTIRSLGGGVNVNDSFPAAANASSPAADSFVTLASGSNTITPPAGTVACTIIPPASNTNSITLKGVSGDTGVRIHNTDPTSIGLDSSVSSFVLTAGSTTSGVRLSWS